MSSLRPSPSPEAPRPYAEALSVEGEDEERKKLQDAITVNEHGVAVCTNPAGTVMKLAAVRIADENVAKHVPLVHEPDGRLALPLHPYRPSRIGFFVGYLGDAEIAAAFRAGNPAIPLITARSAPTRQGGASPAQELVVGLRGIKPTEIDAQQWAIDIGLWRKLNFDPQRSRGLFARATQKEHPPNTWEERRFIVCPPDMDHFPSEAHSYAHPYLFHILGYEVGVPNPHRPVFPPANSPFHTQRAGGLVAVGYPETLPRPSTKNYHETVVSLGSVSVQSLQGAFEVEITADD